MIYPKINSLFLDDFWRIGRQAMKDYYPITRFWGLHSALISAAHPDDLEVIMFILLVLK